MAAVALLLTLMLPVSAIASPELASHEAIVKIVRWAGCQATVVTDASEKIISSYYSRLEIALYIGRDQMTAPYYGSLAVLMHEIGHCLQDQEGVMWDLSLRGDTALELDADRRAADLLCGYGLDGRDILVKLFEWAKVAFGYDGDDRHGTLTERQAQARNATYCQKDIQTFRSIQA